MLSAPLFSYLLSIRLRPLRSTVRPNLSSSGNIIYEFRARTSHRLLSRSIQMSDGKPTQLASKECWKKFTRLHFPSYHLALEDRYLCTNANTFVTEGNFFPSVILVPPKCPEFPTLFAQQFYFNSVYTAARAPIGPIFRLLLDPATIPGNTGPLKGDTSGRYCELSLV